MKKMQQSTVSLLVGLAALLLVIIVLVLIGWLTSKPQKLTIQGTVEAREYRVSGKVAGRVDQLLYQEGDTVSKGQVVVKLDSPELQAKIVQANAQSKAAMAQRAKASGSARSEMVEGAYEMWQKAKVGVDIAKKSYERVENLFQKEVVSAQKRDEAKAQYDAAVATEKAAFSQYNMAKNGAQSEDRMAAQAAVDAANASVDQVNSYIDEINLVSPINGVITEDVWFSFNIREDMLSGITMGSKINVKIPALGDQTYQAEVYFINVMASFATWKPTKASGEFDAKTFEVRARPISPIPHLRAGMSAIVK